MSRRASVRPSTDETLESLLAIYRKTHRSIQVSFRKLVPFIGSGDYATHTVHQYPAKLLAHIPYFFLNNNLLSERNGVVLDPFCGSGTVLLEALLSKRRAIGADSNPLARLIARVKCRSIDAGLLEKAFLSLQDKIVEEVPNVRPDVVNLDHWFYPHVTRQLLSLSTAVKQTEDDFVRDFFLVCLSRCVRRVSLADPRLSVPVRLRKNQYADTHWLKSKTITHLNQLKRINVYKVFTEICISNIVKMKSLVDMVQDNVAADIAYLDSRKLLKDGREENGLADESVDLIITSPPYAGAQKYIRASSLSLGWLGLCPSAQLRRHEAATIGREHFYKNEYCHPVNVGVPEADKILSKIRKLNPLRAHIMAAYLNEMRESLMEMKRVLKPKCFLVMVLGNNEVCGLPFDTEGYVIAIAQQLDLQVQLQLTDIIKYRALMTKRNKTAGVIAKEKVVVLKKD